MHLRQRGYTYSEIQQLVGCKIPKNTFTGWFKNIHLSDVAKERIMVKIKESGSVGRAIAWQNTRRRREQLLERIYGNLNNEFQALDTLTAKIILSILYLGEGGKTNEWIRFGNSDPKIIDLFLRLLKYTYCIDETKLRGRLQCRADQDITKLEEFWSVISKIPPSQFGKALVDKRTVGKPTKRESYKGVFVVEYYSNSLFLELKFLSDIIYEHVKKLQGL